MILSSALEKEGLDEIHRILKGKTTVVAGPSGVGKSSLTNLLQGEVQMETGEISRKLKRPAYDQTFTGDSGWRRYVSDGYTRILVFISDEYGRAGSEKLFSGISKI